MDAGKLFDQSVSSFWAEIQPYFTLRLKEYPRPPYANRYFDQLRLDFAELGGYFPVPEVPVDPPEVCQNHNARKVVSVTLSVLK